MNRKPFRKNESDVVPTGEPPNSLIAVVRRLPHRNEQAGIGDVELAHASSAASPPSMLEVGL